jgi:hypothetical protein
MLDGKIMAAVLATLAAFGVASGSQTDGFNPSEDFKIPSISDMNPRTIGAFTGLIPEDTSTSEVEAKFKYNSSGSQQVSLISESLEIANISRIETNSQTVSSSGNISLENFDGSIVSAKESKIEGQASSILSNGVNVSGGFDFQKTVKTSRIKAVSVKDSDMEFTEVTGTVESGSTSAELSDSTTTVKADSFNGNITFRPHRGEIEIVGEVSSLEAGEVSIG